MDNFTDKALLILPKKDTYTGASSLWKERFSKTIKLIPEIFKSNYDIEMFYLTSNKISNIDMSNYKEIYDITKEDTEFLNIKYPVFYPRRDNKDFIEIKTKSLSRFPSKRGMSDEDREKLIDNRLIFIGKEIAKSFKLIISLERINNSYYNIKHGKMDKRIILRMDYESFKMIPYIASEQCSIIDIMNRQWAYKPIYEWEV